MRWRDLPWTRDPHAAGGPIGRTLLRLAMPNVVVMVVQASIGLIETYFIAKLGTDALAGVALVFPVLMLLQMMSAGAMGGGILSAVARALGAARRERRQRAGLARGLRSRVGLGALTTIAVLAVGAGALYARWAGAAARSRRR